MKIIMICAIGKNYELGKNNDLVWHLPGDLKFFKEKTQGKTVVMGYNTYKSLPNKLPNRKIVVLSEKPIDDVTTYPNEYVMLQSINEDEIYIIGGASLYYRFLNIADELYITHIDATDKEATLYFPRFNLENYQIESLGNGCDNNIDYEFKHYTRKKKDKGKLILIEGTDCSGKETQSTRLVERLQQENILTYRISFPMYNTPTGRIIGACLLGKPYLCEEYLKDNHGWFAEGGGNIDPLVAIDLYAMDRRYNLPKITSLINCGVNVILDRYVTSNMAHRGGMISDKKKRLEMYKIIEQKEYILNELPKPDKTYLLYMPYESGYELRMKRQEKLDEVETNENYLKNGEKAYLELAKLYNYDIIKCTNKKSIRSIEDINDELYNKVKEII